MANGSPDSLKQKSDLAGVVSIVVCGVPGVKIVERLASVPNAKRASIVKEEKGKVWARVYPKSPASDGDLARSVASAASGWQIEEVHTEEGRLDDVFRSITLSDTGAKNNS